MTSLLLASAERQDGMSAHYGELLAAASVAAEAATADYAQSADYDEHDFETHDRLCDEAAMRVLKNHNVELAEDALTEFCEWAWANTMMVAHMRKLDTDDLAMAAAAPLGLRSRVAAVLLSERISGKPKPEQAEAP